VKTVVVGILIAVLAVGVAGWFAVSCGPDRPEAERPVDADEAQLLAGLRYRNFTAEPVAVRMRLPLADGELTVDGYLDWSLPLLYARMPDADGGRRLVQAVPGLVASRPDDAAAFAAMTAPGDGWAARQMLVGPADDQAQTVFDILVSSLFTLSADRVDDAGYLQERAAWRESAAIDGAAVDVFRAPIMVETSGGEAASPEGLYAVDEAGELRRFQINTGGSGLATVDFLRERDLGVEALEPIDLLGGTPIEPADVDEAMAAVLAEVRYANWSRAANVEVNVPVGNDVVVRGHGRVDWRTATVYLNVDDGDSRRLLLVRPGGLAEIDVDDGDDALPVPLPSDGWQIRPLDAAGVDEDFGPLEMLVYRLLEMSTAAPDDAAAIVEHGAVLRVDDDGTDAPVYLVEYPVAGDAPAPAGTSAYRYRVADGRLVEVEMMTFHGVASAELEPADYDLIAIPWGGGGGGGGAPPPRLSGGENPGS
jgi:hypothetical protein